MDGLSIEIDIFKDNKHIYHEVQTTEHLHPTQEQLQYDGNLDLPMLNDTPELKLAYAIDVCIFKNIKLGT